MNKIEQLALIDLFDEIRKGESLQNKIKTKLVHNLKELQNVFIKISSQNKWMTPFNLRQYVNGKIEVSQNDVYVIFSKFDHKQKGRINFEEFKQELVLFQAEEAVKAQKPSYYSHKEVQELFIELIQSFITHEDVINVCRKGLRNIAPYLMFDQIATEKKGYIGSKQLGDFYHINGRKLKESSCSLLMSGLKRRSHSKITLEAFCQNLEPFEMGCYQSYKQSIQEQQRRLSEKIQKEETQIALGKKKLQDKIDRAQNKNKRIKEAEQDRMRITEQLRKLKLFAEKEKEQRKQLERTLSREQMVRHELQSQIDSYKNQLKETQYDRNCVFRLQGIRNEELMDSRELEDQILKQEEYLDMLRDRLYLDKSQMLQRSNKNDERIQKIKRHQNRQLRQLQIQQQTLYNKLLSPVTQKSSMKSSKTRMDASGIGRIYKPVDTPAYDLYKSNLGSTNGESTLWMNHSQSEPKFSTSYLYRY